MKQVVTAAIVLCLLVIAGSRAISYYIHPRTRVTPAASECYAGYNRDGDIVTVICP